MFGVNITPVGNHDTSFLYFCCFAKPVLPQQSSLCPIQTIEFLSLYYSFMLYFSFIANIYFLYEYEERRESAKVIVVGHS